jgi:iron complex transport system substrate-binding protein
VAARTKSLILVVVLLATGGLKATGYPARTVVGDLQVSGTPIPNRIVSLVPSLTEMLFAIGAGPQVVGVSSYDTYPPEAKSRPRVGALLDPDVERILSLRPDLVLTYASQTSFEAQLGRAGIRSFSYRHGGIDVVLGTLRRLGAVTGHEGLANRKAEEIQAQLNAIRMKVRGRDRPRVMLVFARPPGSLQQLFAAGGTGFLHDILDIAGAVNVFADVERESVQPSHETMIRRAPDIILEISGTREISEADTARSRKTWAALASIPAVKSGRIYFLSGDYLVIPGPRVPRSAEAFARVIHPEAFK